MISDDPWDWNVDQVVQYLCFSHDSWASEIYDQYEFPNISGLEAQLREQGIRGWVLLTAVDHDLLRSEFGIKSIAQRAAVIFAIKALRNRSPKYNFKSGFSPIPPPETPLAEPQPAGAIGTTEAPSDFPPQTPAVAKRSREDISTISSPRDNVPKRRRLDVPTQLTTVPLNTDRSGKNNISTNSIGAPTAPPATSSSSSQSKLSMDEIFFPEQNDSYNPEALLDETITPLDYSVSFVRTKHASRSTAVASRFVYRAMKSFLCNPEREEYFDGEATVTTVFPYRESKHTRTDRLRGRFEFRSTQDGVSCRSVIPVCDEWTYLEKWNQDSKIIPMDELAEGESTNQSDDSGSDEDSMIIEDATATQTMKQDTVAYLVDLEIKRYTDSWALKKLPKLIQREKAELSKMSFGRTDRERIVSQLKKDIEHYRSQLRRQSDEIATQVWNGVDEVERICAILEQTVYNSEESKWRLTIVDKIQKSTVKQPGRRVKYGTKSTTKSRATNDDMKDFILDDEWGSTDPITHGETTPKAEVAEDLVSNSEPSTKPTLECSLESRSMSVSSLDRRTQNAEENNFSNEDSAMSTTTTIVPPRRSASPSSNPSHPEWPSFIGPNIEVIDLYSDSDHESEKSSNEKSQTAPIIPTEQYWHRLIQNGDPVQLVTAIVVHLLSETEAYSLVPILARKDGMWRRVKATLSWISRGAKVERSDQPSVTLLTRLYLVFGYCSMIPYNHNLSELCFDARRSLTEWFTGKTPMEADRFCQAISDAVKAKDDAVDEIELDGEDLVNEEFLSRPGKKPLHTDQIAKQTREDALRRQAEQADREELLKQDVVTDADTGTRSIVINILRKDGEPTICLHPAITKEVQDHQIEGIRFMWREVVTAAGKTNLPQGCLLAHTMGLGKTMQTISLLITIGEAARSNDPFVVNQLPTSLRRIQSLVTCPSGLVDNWLNELNRWVPHPFQASVGKIRSVTSEMTKSARCTALRLWERDGGVLVIGFSLLVLMADLKKADEYPGARAILLEGPSIVVADEAHNLKNPDSKLAAIAQAFKTRARIALTGSPLANNLREYYSLVEWISPGYLGPLVEFTARFQRPIEEGLYADSLKVQRRQSLKRLAVFKKEIEPKVSRADITVLKGKLPPKIEFVLTVALSPMQKECYSMYVDHRRESLPTSDKLTNASLWTFTSALMMLCNHPSVFYNNLYSNPRQKSASKDTHDEENEDTELETVPLWNAELKEKFSIIFKNVDMSSEKLSWRTAIFLEIVRHTKQAGDQLLAFTHSLGMLDFLEKMLTFYHISYVRLDGLTKHSVRYERMASFNNGGAVVFLASTRAGGCGFNLPGASRVVIFDSGFNPVHEEQAVARAYRLGQKKPVYVYRFITGGTFQEQLNHQSVFKTQLAIRVVDTKNPRSLAMKPDDYIYHPKDIAEEDLSEYVGKDPTVLDKILATNGGLQVTSPSGGGDAAGSKQNERMILRISTMETLRVEADDDLTPEELREVEAIRTLEKQIRQASTKGTVAIPQFPADPADLEPVVSPIPTVVSTPVPPSTNKMIPRVVTTESSLAPADPSPSLQLPTVVNTEISSQAPPSSSKPPVFVQPGVDPPLGSSSPSHASFSSVPAPPRTVLASAPVRAESHPHTQVGSSISTQPSISTLGPAPESVPTRPLVSFGMHPQSNNAQTGHNRARSYSQQQLASYQPPRHIRLDNNDNRAIPSPMDDTFQRTRHQSYDKGRASKPPAWASPSSLVTTTPAPVPIPKPPPLRPSSPTSIDPENLREVTEALKRPEWLKQQITSVRSNGGEKPVNPNLQPLGRRQRNLR